MFSVEDYKQNTFSFNLKQAFLPNKSNSKKNCLQKPIEHIKKRTNKVLISPSNGIEKISYLPKHARSVIKSSKYVYIKDVEIPRLFSLLYTCTLAALLIRMLREALQLLLPYTFLRTTADTLISEVLTILI